jgi:hypothetical protein
MIPFFVIVEPERYALALTPFFVILKSERYAVATDASAPCAVEAL